MGTSFDIGVMGCERKDILAFYEKLLISRLVQLSYCLLNSEYYNGSIRYIIVARYLMPADRDGRIHYPLLLTEHDRHLLSAASSSLAQFDSTSEQQRQ